MMINTSAINNKPSRAFTEPSAKVSSPAENENSGVQSPQETFEAGELLVRLRADMATLEPLVLPGEIIEEFNQHEGLKTLGSSDRVVRLKLDEGAAVEDTAALLSEDPSVAWAEPNYIWSLDADVGTNDKYSNRLWGMEAIKAPEAWKESTGSRDGAIIAVLDSGMDINHPDLANNVWANTKEVPGNGLDDDKNGIVDDVHGYNALEHSGDVTDELDHGTHVAGTIGAEGNNRIGVAGVNWQTRIMPIKIFGGDGRTNSAAILRGLSYAKAMGADITNNSWGGAEKSSALEDAFATNPALHVCASGNSKNNNDKKNHYPSGYDLPNLISVAATGKNGRLASFSNYGRTTVDIAAPGKGIVSTVPSRRGKGRYKSMDGTSMASPHVAGAAVLVKTKFPEASASEIKEILTESSDPLPRLRRKVKSGGQLNVDKALEGRKS